jgi:integrase
MKLEELSGNNPLPPMKADPIAEPHTPQGKRKPKALEFPITVKGGSSTVKIYKGVNRGKPLYTLTYILPGGRKREFFRDLIVAQTQAKARAEKMAAGDLEALRLTGIERQLYVAAAEAIKPTGLSLDAAAREFAAAFRVLGGNSILEAARYFAANVLRGLPDMSVAEAVESYISAKETEGHSALYMKDLRGSRGRKREGEEAHGTGGLLGRFKAAFSCQLRAVTADQLRKYLGRLNVGPTTRNSHLRLLTGLFSHAKAHGWLDQTRTTAADAIKAAKKPIESVEIYAPGELAELLEAADDDFRAWLVLIAFCGVRREEIARLTWDAVDFDQGCIIVPAAVAKTKRRRKIDLQPNAAKWLAPYRGQKVKIFAIDPRKRMVRTVSTVNERRKKAKNQPLAWKTNALRHSFCSYRLEATRNAGQVALEAGNSAGIIMRHLSRSRDCQGRGCVVGPCSRGYARGRQNHSNFSRRLTDEKEADISSIT